MTDPGWAPPDQGPSPISRSPSPRTFTTPSGGSPGEGRPWALIVLLGGLLLVVVVVIVTLVAGVGTELSVDDPATFPEQPGTEDLGLPSAPPSERGELPTTSVPRVVDELDRSTRAAAGGEEFAELTCEFTGTSRLAEPLPMDESFSAAPNEMTLEPGAAFDCTDGGESSAGTIELTAAFESLSAVDGVGAGQGRIRWGELPEARRVPGVLAPESTTGVEVQLQVPVIVVWTTIVDGPYAGYRGRLVLRDWEPIFVEGGISGARFATTSTTFAPG